MGILRPLANNHYLNRGKNAREMHFLLKSTQSVEESFKTGLIFEEKRGKLHHPLSIFFKIRKGGPIAGRKLSFEP